MKSMTYKGYSARVEFDPEDEIFVGRLAGVKDVVGFHADAAADLKTAFHEAVDDYIDTCAKMGKEPQKSFSGNMMFRVDPEIHYRAAVAADMAGKSLNEWGQDVLSKALG